MHGASLSPYSIHGRLRTEAIDRGQRVYWDTGNGHITESSAGNCPVGAATRPAGNGAESVRVRLDGVSTVPAP